MKKYDEFARWETTEKEDKAAFEEGRKWTHKRYWLGGQNCEDLAGSIVKATGKKWADKLSPKKSWKENKKNANQSGEW